MTSGAAKFNTRICTMSDEVKKITIQVKPPKGQFPGEVVIGHYCVVEGSVVLTDETGKPIAGAAKHQLGPGEDARLRACLMVRNNRRGRASVGGFNRPIHYPKLVY
jgi:hypothetical protein